MKDEVILEVYLGVGDILLMLLHLGLIFSGTITPVFQLDRSNFIH